MQVTLAVLVSSWAHVLHAIYKPWGPGSVMYTLQHGSLLVTSFVFLMGLLFKVNGVSTSSPSYSALAVVMLLLCIGFLVFWLAVVLWKFRGNLKQLRMMRQHNQAAGSPAAARRARQRRPDTTGAPVSSDAAAPSSPKLGLAFSVRRSSNVRRALRPVAAYTSTTSLSAHSGAGGAAAFVPGTTGSVDDSRFYVLNPLKVASTQLRSSSSHAAPDTDDPHRVGSVSETQ
jgi:hypothetical protein